MKQNWIDRYISLALFVAEWSKDPKTKVGAVIVSPENTPTKNHWLPLWWFFVDQGVTKYEFY